ncbi:response regulator [Sphingomonas sp.]|uniref:response regulator n=1 Tax=Sphingomonas sp. TaxID=28214 RepID=UPI0028B13DA9|nr:response regulator [Sphingomonas sp.]
MIDTRKASVPIVLVVEDEPLLRLFAAQVVEDAGYEALEAASAAEAIAILESRPDIRIVFTDIDMPGGLDGIKLAACIRDRWPPIKIIITSGKPLPPSTVMPAEAVFFPKPYRQDRVIASLHRLAA